MRHPLRNGGRVARISVLVPFLLMMAAVAPVGAASSRDCSDRVLEPGADLRRCDLRELPVSGADLSGATIERAILTGMNLDNGPDGPETTFAGASLVRADLSGAILSATSLSAADLSGADLSETRYEDSSLADATLRRADLSGSSMFFTSAARADFERANLEGASILHSFVVDANLDHSRLAGADLTGTNLTGASLDGATGLETVTWSGTTCPDGSNSDDVGGTCIGHL